MGREEADIVGARVGRDGVGQNLQRPAPAGHRLRAGDDNALQRLWSLNSVLEALLYCQHDVVSST